MRLCKTSVTVVSDFSIPNRTYSSNVLPVLPPGSQMVTTWHRIAILTLYFATRLRVFSALSKLQAAIVTWSPSPQVWSFLYFIIPHWHVLLVIRLLIVVDRRAGPEAVPQRATSGMLHCISFSMRRPVTTDAR